VIFTVRDAHQVNGKLTVAVRAKNVSRVSRTARMAIWRIEIASRSADAVNVYDNGETVKLSAGETRDTILSLDYLTQIRRVQVAFTDLDSRAATSYSWIPVRTK